MKKVIISTVALLIFSLSNAQVRIDKHLDFSGKKTVKLDIQIADSIKIRTWDKSEVYVNATISINDNRDNDAYETSFSETGDVLVVKAEFRDGYFTGKENGCVETDIFWEITIPAQSKLSTESINADITITGDTGPMDIRSISGFIDLTVPEKRKANLDFSTLTGTIYSNHQVKSDASGNDITSHVKYSMNTGGDLIRLETISGDIYFRK